MSQLRFVRLLSPATRIRSGGSLRFLLALILLPVFSFLPFSSWSPLGARPALAARCGQSDAYVLIPPAYNQARRPITQGEILQLAGNGVRPRTSIFFNFYRPDGSYITTHITQGARDNSVVYQEPERFDTNRLPTGQVHVTATYTRCDTGAVTQEDEGNLDIVAPPPPPPCPDNNGNGICDDQEDPCTMWPYLCYYWSAQIASKE